MTLHNYLVRLQTTIERREEIQVGNLLDVLREIDTIAYNTQGGQE